MNAETIEFNLRHLRAFTEVFRQGSVSAAAGAVHLSQPALTQALTRLEGRLGTQLFRRTPQGMVPTRPAELLDLRVHRAFSMLRAGIQDASRRQRQARAVPFDTAVTRSQLRALLAVEDNGNFSVAARALGLSQPSVHRAARELEKLSGLALFAPSVEGIALTRAGSGLARGARLMFAELDQAVAEIAALAGAEASSLAIGGLPLARSTILPRAFARLASARPAMRLRVVEGPYADLLHALRHGSIDVMVGALRDPAPADDVVQESLFEDRLGIFAGPSHPLAGRSAVTGADLSRFPWVVPAPGTPTRAVFDRFIGGVETPPGMIETSSMMLVRSLLQDSLHLTMLSVNQIRFDADRGSVVRLPVALNDPPRPIGLTRRSDWRPTEAQAEVLDFLREESRAFG